MNQNRREFIQSAITSGLGMCGIPMLLPCSVSIMESVEYNTGTTSSTTTSTTTTTDSPRQRFKHGDQWLWDDSKQQWRYMTEADWDDLESHL